MKTMAVINPNAADGAGKRDWPRIRRALDRARVDYEPVFTSGPMHAAELAAEAAGRGFDCVLAVGGDGTVNEAVNGLMRIGTDADSRPALGVIPTGTGGDLCRTLGVEGGIPGAVKHFCEGRVRYLDLGLLEYMDRGERRRRYFDNITGVGFDGEVTDRMNKNNLPIRGTIPYLAAFFQTLFRYENRRMRIGIDERTLEVKANMVVVANGRYFGGGMRVAPGAEPDDGLFDVVLFGDMTRLEQITNGARIYRGGHVRHPKVRVFRARRVSVEADAPTLVQPDGEVVGHAPASFDVAPAAIRIICPCK